MTIIELCGTPGCGKSTTFKAFKNKYPALVGTLGDFKNIYPPSALLRGIVKRWYFVKTKYLTFLLNKEEKKIGRFMAENEDKKGLYFAKTLAIYNGIKRNAGSKKTVLLDEGIIQHLSSASFSKQICALKELDSVFMSLRDVKYICIRFQCDQELTAERIAHRHNGKRYDIADKAQLLKALAIKDNNIDELLSRSGFEVKYIDTKNTPEDNAQIIAGVIEELI